MRFVGSEEAEGCGRRATRFSVQYRHIRRRAGADCWRAVSHPYEPPPAEGPLCNAPIPGDAMRKYGWPVLPIEIHDADERTTDRHDASNDRARACPANQVDPAAQIQSRLTAAPGVLRQQTVKEGRRVDAAHTAAVQVQSPERGYGDFAHCRCPRPARDTRTRAVPYARRDHTTRIKCTIIDL